MYKQEQIKPYGNEGSKREQVEAMFNNIAPTYDTLNHTLSFGIDKLWRQTAINYLKPYFATRRNASILDIATGTGDFALLAYEQLSPQRVIGCDISERMMQIGREKIARRGLADKIELRREDCASMSFESDSFDAVISAFALRNFQNLNQCLTEMHRVLAPNGRFCVVDLCAPRSFPMKQLFWLYKKAVMPLVGKLLSRDSSAYSYLPDTMDAVPQAEQMQAIISQAGFRNANYRRLLFGMCILYTAEK